MLSEKLRQRLANHQPGREVEANSGNFGTLLLRFCSQTKTKTAESISDVSPHGHISCSHKQEEKKQLLVAKKSTSFHLQYGGAVYAKTANMHLRY